MTCLEKEIIEDIMLWTRARRRPHTPWQKNIRTWTELLSVQAVRATENPSQWRKIARDLAKP